MASGKCCSSILSRCCFPSHICAPCGCAVSSDCCAHMCWAHKCWAHKCWTPSVHLQVPAYYALILRSLTVLEGECLSFHVSAMCLSRQHGFKCSMNMHSRLTQHEPPAGLALSADSNYKLLAKAYPYMARRLLTDPRPELRATFEELMLKDGQFRWSRLLNLIRESRKTIDTDPERVWLIAEWFFSEDGKYIRTKVEDVRSLGKIVVGPAMCGHPGLGSSSERRPRATCSHCQPWNACSPVS